MMTISRAVMLQATWPLWPTVTRLPLRVMVPSTLPSINNDSVPVISPLMNRPLPMVAWSPVVAGARLGYSTDEAGAAGRDGSGIKLGVAGPDWLGFHIALTMNPFLSWRDGAF